MTEVEKLYSILNDEANVIGVRLEALSRIKLLEYKYMTQPLPPPLSHYLTLKEEMETMTAATPEPSPIANRHPAIADVVAAELVAENAPMVATDVMARKEFGMKKYGTPLQPFNGRDTYMDLYQELLDAMKYARVALYEAQLGSCKGTYEVDAEEAYESLKQLCMDIRNLMEKRDGAANNTGNAACVF